MNSEIGKACYAGWMSHWIKIHPNSTADRSWEKLTPDEQAAWTAAGEAARKVASGLEHALNQVHSEQGAAAVDALISELETGPSKP